MSFDVIVSLSVPSFCHLLFSIGADVSTGADHVGAPVVPSAHLTLAPHMCFSHLLLFYT